MTAQDNTQERSRLHRWIDVLPPRQFELVYRLVEEFVEGERDDTEYLLSSETMKERLLASRESEEGIPLEAVREKLGI